MKKIPESAPTAAIADAMITSAVLIFLAPESLKLRINNAAAPEIAGTSPKNCDPREAGISLRRLLRPLGSTEPRLVS